MTLSWGRYYTKNRVGCDLFILVPAVCVVEKDLRGLSERLLFWEQDLPAPSSLLSELKLWQQFWMQKAQHEIPSNISDTLISTDEDVFPNIHLAVKLKGHFLAYGALKSTYAAL